MRATVSRLFSYSRIRKMPLPFKEYLVIVQDKPNSFDKRMEVRDQHLGNIKSVVKAQGPGNGPMTSGGGIAHDKDQNLCGSMLTIEAESKEKVIEMLKEDVYYTSGVWDVDNAQIFAVSIPIVRYILLNY